MSRSMTIIASLIVNCDSVYNGHNQLHLSTALTSDSLIPLMAELEMIMGCTTTLKLWSDGSGTLYQESAWGEGEHPSGDTDKVLLSWSCTDG